MSNPMPFESYSTAYSALTKSTPHFLLEIKCYHIKEGLKKKKVVTHTAEEEYHPAKWRVVNARSAGYRGYPNLRATGDTERSCRDYSEENIRLLEL